MSTIAMLVVLLLVLVGVIVFGGLAYLSHRHPPCREPLLVGLTGVAWTRRPYASMCRSPPTSWRSSPGATAEVRPAG